MLYNFVKKTVEQEDVLLNLLENSRKSNKIQKTNTSKHSSNTNKPKAKRYSFEDYLTELRQYYINEIKNQWLKPNPTKKYLSVTEVITCPLQTWFKLSGSLTSSDIEEDKIFYLLVLYGKIGDVIHDEIYKTMFFEHTEKMIYDKQNFLRGKFDIIDNNFLIDIKSSREKSNHAPQLSLYLHLAKLAGYNINRVGIWYVLRDEIEEYDISYIESLIPKYLERAKLIKKHLELRTPPQEIDEEYCKYCLVQKKCASIRNNMSNNNEDESKIQNNDQIILQFDVKF